MPSAAPTTIHGTLELVPNPCTTRPCLPGLAFAVVADGVPYFLTKGGALCMQDRAWDDELPAPGTPISVKGTVEERWDMNNCRYITIEFSAARSNVP